MTVEGQPRTPACGVELAKLQTALECYLTGRCGRKARVGELGELAGGASRRIYGFRLYLDGEPEACPLVLRMDPDKGRIQSDRREEFEILSVAFHAGVSVPRVHWFGNEEDGLGAPFLIMDKAEGQAIARRLLRDDAYAQARRALPASLARNLARIHAIDLGDERLTFLRERAPEGRDPGRFAVAEIDRYQSMLALAGQGFPQPVLELAARWLRQHAPTLDRPVLVHGDFRIGNILFDEKGLTAVLDWELAHAGDPAEDVAWLSVRSWRFGHNDKPVGGLCGRREFLDLYEAAGGRALEPARLSYWELFGNWKWAVICVGQAASHRAGRYPDVELASLGRRVAEVEWEILSLLDQAWSNAG